MILVYKQWNKVRDVGPTTYKSGHDGWYLFGIIPLVVRHFVAPWD